MCIFTEKAGSAAGFGEPQGRIIVPMTPGLMTELKLVCGLVAECQDRSVDGTYSSGVVAVVKAASTDGREEGIECTGGISELIDMWWCVVMTTKVVMSSG